MSQSEAMPQEIQAPAPTQWRRTLLSSLFALLWCAAIFTLCLWLYTRNNDFPVDFHPDEPGKVQQVIRDERNYKHPQLLLEATQWWVQTSDVPADDQSVVIAGRQVAALFGALTAAMLALTAYLCARWWGLVLASVLLALCPPLLTYSHYMKEDTSLVVGVAMCILASRLIWITRRWYARIPSWCLIALGCAVATSGKYVGAMTIALPLALVLVAPGFRWYRPFLRLTLFVPMFALLLGLINYRTLNPAGLDFATVAHDPAQWQILFNPSFLSGLESETQHSSTVHWGLTANRPNTYAMRTSISQTWPYVAICALSLPLVLLLTRRQGWGWETLMILFMVLVTYVLSYSIILFPRYVLPVTVMLHLFAAIALSRIIYAISRRPVARFTLGCTLTVLALALFAPVCADYNYQFLADSRYALNNWATENIPRSARVFADGYAAIGNSALPFAHMRQDVNVRSSFILPQMGGFEYQLNSGEAYYVICDLSYSRYFEPSAYPGPGYEEQSKFSKRFYQYLLTTQTPVWSSVPKRSMEAFTNPTIHVYRMTLEMFRDMPK